MKFDFFFCPSFFNSLSCSFMHFQLSNDIQINFPNYFWQILQLFLVENDCLTYFISYRWATNIRISYRLIPITDTDTLFPYRLIQILKLYRSLNKSSVCLNTKWLHFFLHTTIGPNRSSSAENGPCEHNEHGKCT